MKPVLVLLILFAVSAFAGDDFRYRFEGATLKFGDKFRVNGEYQIPATANEAKAFDLSEPGRGKCILRSRISGRQPKSEMKVDLVDARALDVYIRSDDKGKTMPDVKYELVLRMDTHFLQCFWYNQKSFASLKGDLSKVGIEVEEPSHAPSGGPMASPPPAPPPINR